MLEYFFEFKPFFIWVQFIFTVYNKLINHKKNM